MATRTGHIAQRLKSRVPGRRAARSTPVRFLGRAGFLARGLLYIVIGWISLEIAFGKTSQQADRSGVVQALGRTAGGEVALWILGVGLFGMAVWRLAEAAFGPPVEDKDKRKAVWVRLSCLAKAVVYAVLGYGVLQYAVGAGSPPSSDQESVGLTATLMRQPGGRAAVIVIGLVLIGSGLYLAYQALRARFRKDLLLSQMGRRTAWIVDWLGRIGGIARGAVFITAGVFLIVAAAEAKPGEAKGIDSSLRALTETPLGPWLLALVALGLIIFGLFSCCETRWRRV
jgi:uncharacterized membrane protein YhdT